MRKTFWISFFVAIIVIFILAFFIWTDLFTPQLPNEDYKKNNGFETSKQIDEDQRYGVSSSNPMAVEVGMEVLESGGNAVDAAIAVSYALNVVEPYGSGIGGGGGMLIQPANHDEAPTFFDYREISPVTGSETEKGIGIPGFVKGMEVIHGTYGEKELSELIQPAIDLAEDGFVVLQTLTNRLSGAQYRMPVKQLSHFYPDGKPIQENEILQQPELADTLELIREKGSNVFYNGEIAEEITAQVKGIDQSDLENYSVIQREPVYGEYQGYDIISAPPPFSGITVIQSLQIADTLNIKKTKENTVGFTHLIGEITKRTYTNRSKNLGDPTFLDNGIKDLADEDYVDELAEDISEDKLSEQYRFDKEEEHESTTHFVVIDKEGMVVSGTNTLSNFFGSGKHVKGFFLNNQLKNFNQNPDSPNYYEPGKRSRTFMAPTILMNDDKIIGIGSPGGARIPMMLTEVLVRYLTFDQSLQESIEAPRFFIEDNKVYTEVKYLPKIQNDLKDIGYLVEYKNSPIYYGGVQVLVRDGEENVMFGAGDPRRNGTWKVK